MRVLPLLAVLLLALGSGLLPTDSGLAEDPLPPASEPRADFGEAFGYQGRLVQDGIPANGTFEFEFYLYSAASAGTQVGSAIPLSLPVANGIFSTQLNFGAEVLSAGSTLWVEVRVKKPADIAFTVLSPRQRLAPAPYSIAAGTLPAGSRINVDEEQIGLRIQEQDGTSFLYAALGSKSAFGVTGIAAYGLGAAPAESFGGYFLGSTAGVRTEAFGGYGLLAKTDGAARAAVLAEHTGSTCTGGTIGPNDPLQQFCYAIAGIADSSSTHGVGVYGYATNTAIWGKTDNPDGYSGYFEGGKVRMSDGTIFGITSDGRLKKDIAALSVGLDELLELKPSTYAWKRDETSTPHYGFIAQEVREVLPLIVDEDADGTLSLEPLGLLPVIVQAIQEQQTQIDALQPRNTGTSNSSMPSAPALAAMVGALLVGMFGAGFAGVIAGRRLAIRPQTPRNHQRETNNA